ncbi:sec1 family domain-containing protein MIP3 isoform X1 [Solanum pennellii]|uniref:Sec1 family domain-containing protein MIP3 isoform X1 n=1 Tax=Solanum pennellii TaxID=28526 RepID=A0ABM1FTT8_SOLPN|nr:sec1 family domain-containing protein MIP3 isoform X1 [Solanum pennellii]
MATVDVIKCCMDSIRQISDEIRDAIIYLDAGCTESFEYVGAFSLFLELGAHSICSLEKMSPLDKVVDWNSTSGPAKKIVVITSRLLSDAHRYILRCLSAFQTLRSCAIFTCISETGHSAYPESPLGPDAYHEYESLLVQDYEELARKFLMNSSHTGESIVKESKSAEDEGWSQLTTSEEGPFNFSSVASAQNSYEDSVIDRTEDVRKKLKVSVHHFPLVLCPFSPRFFVLPSEGSVAEAYLSAEHDNSISFGLPSISTGTTADAEDVPPGATLTAQFLYHLAAKMDLKLEIFSLGDVSKTVGKLLTDMSSLYDVGRRKRSAGLLLIDRTLDLLTPCCHGDSLVDQMFSSLPHRERMASLSQAKSSQSQVKLGPAYLQRSPLTVQIPLNNFLREDTSSSYNFQLVESVEAFLRGWNSRDPTSQMDELVNFSTKPSGEMSTQDFQSDLLCGSFVSTENFHGTPYLEAILERRSKDGAVLIKKWLQESLRRENVSLNAKIRPGYASKSDLQTMIKALAKSQSLLAKNKGIIQLAAAALSALDESHSAKWDAFSSAEKILNVNAGDTSQSLAAQISDLINKSALVSSQGNNKMDAQRGLLTLQDALLLTVVGYILAGENFPSSGTVGPFSWQEEHFMKEAIVDAIIENPTVAKLKFLKGLTQDLEANFNRKSEEKKEDLSNTESIDFDDDDWGSWGDEDSGKDKRKEQVYDDMQLKLELRDRVDNLFKFFHKLSSLKKNVSFREWSQALSKFNDDPYSNKGLLYKVLSRVLDKHEVPGLEYHSSTVGRLFKSGFGRFGLGQAKPSLADHDVILVFVVGGINGVEVREAQEALSESNRPEVELILGGTTFLTPKDMFELLLGDYCCV